jgi:acetyl-CoA carboxylase biotin carboxyl carrier protein
MNLSHEDVLEILALLDASGFDELRLETDRYKLLLRRPGAPVGNAASAGKVASAGNAAAAGLSATPASASAQPSIPQMPPGHRNGLIDVISPMVGVFYSAPKPGEKPFVEVGSVVEEQTVVGIIEVMKLMNSISAGKRGTVVEIVAADGELVQYGSVLVRIAPPDAEV